MKPDSCLLSVIIISFNTADLTVACLQSVLEDAEKSKLLQNKFEIILVDNDSQDDSVKHIEQFKQKQRLNTQLQIIKNQSNEGFAKANNRALQQALGKYVLLLNSDTIVQPGALESLINSFESQHPETSADQLGLVAASLWNPDGSYQSQGGDQISLLSAKVQWLLLDDLPVIGQYLPTLQRKQSHPPANRTFQPMGWVGGTALCFPELLYKSLGGLDENIFMYAEDMEYCLRAQKAGWQCGINHTAKVTHYGSASGSSEKAKLGEVVGLRYIWKKHFSTPSALALRLIIFSGALLRVVLFSILGKASLAKTYRTILQSVIV